MTLIKSSNSVHIEKPQESLGELMNSIRVWLDWHKIQPTEFKSNVADGSVVALDIRFRREDEAELFEAEFV